MFMKIRDIRYYQTAIHWIGEGFPINNKPMGADNMPERRTELSPFPKYFNQFS